MDSGDLAAILSVRDGAIVVPVFAQPRASRSKVMGIHDGMLKIALAAPPVDGAANKALIKFVAKLLGVSKSAVTLVSGDSGRRKRLSVEGMTVQEVVRRLA